MSTCRLFRSLAAFGAGGTREFGSLAPIERQRKLLSTLIPPKPN